MAKRRTSGIQRRERASGDALNRRLDDRTSSPLGDWRILAIGGVLVVGAVVVVLALVFASGPNPNVGTAQPDDGRDHTGDGISCRTDPASCGVADVPYSSTPATSGPHWNTAASWGVYTTPQNESQLIHNLEHGGVVIWYQPEQLDEPQLGELSDYVRTQASSGISGRFKFILSPWNGEDFGHPIAVTAWRSLLYLDSVDLGAIDDFTGAHYGQAPEPNGGPGPGEQVEAMP